MVNQFIMVFSHCDCLKVATRRSCSASVVHFWQVYWHYSVNSVEVIVVNNFVVFTGQLSAHDWLRVLHVPWGSVQARWRLGIYEQRVVARRLQLVVALQFHSFNDVLNDIMAAFDVVCWRLSK